MCDQRERLIGYLYDECDARERREVDRHLEGCPVCREEVQGLRQVRTDLLAWAVPDTPGVWRPLPTPLVQTWWRQVPAWALAAAASLVLMAGVTGGVAARAVGSPQTATGPVSPAPVAIGISAAELSAAQDRILALMRAELDRRAGQTPVTQAVRYAPAEDHTQITQRLNDLSRASDDNLQAIAMLYTDILSDYQRADARIKQLQFTVEQLAASLNQNR